LGWWVLVLLAMAPWVRAEVRTFEIGGQAVLLERAEPAAGVFFRAFRPNQATGRWEVDVVVTNGTGRTLRLPLVMRFETATAVAPGIQGATLDADGKPFFHLTPLVATTGFAPGTALRAFTLSLGDAKTRPELAVALYSAPETPDSLPLGVARVLTVDGLPAEGTEAEEIGPVTPRKLASGRGGWLSLEAGPGVRGWTFRAPGMEPVVRLADGLGSGSVTELLTVRQVPVDAGGTTRFPVQALPAPLPRGWSPAVVIRGEAGAREVELLEILPVGREAVWARWDAVQLAWKAVERVTGTGLRRVSVSLTQAGIHGLLVPDGGDAGPAIPAVGGTLAGVNGAGVPTGLQAVGVVDPASASASREAARVTARARVEISSTAGALVSGLEVPCEVVEEYRLRDGSRRKLPAYTLRLIAFRPLNGPGTGPLVAEFPVRPFQLLAGEELSEARIRVDVLPPGAFAGGVLRADGSPVTAGSVRIEARAGDLAGAEAVLLREPSLGSVGELIPAGVTLVRAFELGVGAVAPGRRLGVDFGAVDPSSSHVLARAVFDAGQHGFQPVLRLVSDAAGKLTVTDPAEGGLPGVDGGGQYLLLKTAAPEALVEGVARNASGQPERGLVVRRGPWTALTDSNGRYRLLAPAGASEIRVLDVVRGDSGTSTVNVGALLAALQADVGTGQVGPVVVSVSPTNNAVGVARVTPVAVSFSRALNPATVIAGGVQLVDPAGAVVTASVTLNLAGTTVTVLPVNALASATAYRLKVASTVLDLAGRAVEGAREFGFTTVDDTVVRSLAAQVTIYAPGSTNLTPALLGRIPAYDPVRDRDGIVVEGSPGTAEPGQKVVLVNESSGETQTVLSDVDGSFVSFVRGSVDDFISAVLVNANGTRNQIPATRQRFDDGTVGLFASGGTIRSTGPGTPVDLIVDPGSLAGKTLFKIETIETTAFSALAGGRLPEGALPPIGAFELTESGDPLLEAADIRIPVKLADMGFPPGALPTNVSFVVVMPIRVDGRVVHQIVDTANYEADGPEGGTLRTASPPFVGMLARKLAQVAKDSGASVVTTPKVASNNDNPHKGETAAFGILPMISRGPLKVGGFVRAVTRNEDGTETATPVAGATVRVLQSQDERDGAPVVFDGDLVSISDETGNFGFFFRPSDSTATRALIATHPRFPFQRPRTGAFAGERQGTTVVTAELLFQESAANQAALSDQSRPAVTVGHEPSLPRTGTGADDGAILFVVGVDDTIVGPPRLRVTSVQNLRGETLPDSEAILTLLTSDADQPGRKVRQFRLQMAQAGRVTLEASVADGAGHEDRAQHAVVFGVSRPPVPGGDPNDTVPLRVAFSWPPSKGTNVPSLEPIVLRFNRALPTNALQSGQLRWLTLHSAHTLRRVTASGDRREITVFYDGAVTGPVKLTVGTGVQGESGASFDQDSEAPGAQAFVMEFTQASAPVVNFDGDTGAGVLMQGRFAYALERRGTAGTLKVLDLVDPQEPEELRTVNVGYPTAMALIPEHSLPGAVSRTAGAEAPPCDTGNWLALFTGHANEPKYLQLGRLGAGRVQFGPRLILSGGGTDADGQPSVAEGVTTAESLSQIVKAKWSPPFLGYFELGADVTSIRLLNLASFRRAELAGGSVGRFTELVPGSPGRVETPGFAGLDANNDGDYCDVGDQWPVPDNNPLVAPGTAFSIAPKTQQERIEDFDFDGGLGLVVGISRFLGTNGAPRFSTLLAAADTNDLSKAFVSFGATETPRRVLLLPGLALETPTNRVVRDIALVTLGTGGDGVIAVVDVTVPSVPSLLNRFFVPIGEGTPAGMQVRPDGLLVVATSRSTLLLEPGRIALPSNGGQHPSFVGRVDGTGTGVRDFVADASGINLTHGGATRRYVETAPKFSFVHFNAPIQPKDLAAQPAAQVERFLKSATQVRAAEVSFPGEGINAPPLVGSRHYYALVDAPGGAADGAGLLPLVLSAVDSTGRPQSQLGGTVVPAVLGDDQLYSALLTKRFVDAALTVVNIRRGLGAVVNAPGAVAKISAALGSAKDAKRVIQRLKALADVLLLVPDEFVARRLTDDADHPLYNRFLAGPFVVLGGAPTLDQLRALKQQASSLGLDRVYLRPSPRLWVGLPSESQPTLIQRVNPFAAEPTKLPSFVSQLRLNATVTLLGINIPFADDLIGQAAKLTVDNPSTPIGTFFEQAKVASAMVGLLGNAPVVGAILKSDWQPHLLPGAHGLLKVNFAERPMVLVPGFAGSKLEVSGKTAWIELALTDGGRELKSLRVNPDGTPVEESFATDAIRFSLETPVIDLNSIYGDWIGHLTTEMGMNEYEFRKQTGLRPPGGAEIRQRMKLGTAALMNQVPFPNLFVFPYDWRLDNAKSAEQLKEYVRLALEMHPDADGIDLVGHSNGGLVARAYMEMPGQRPLVKRMITVGTPWLGSPKPLAGLRTGDMSEPMINLIAPIPSVRKMLQFAPGVHQLLPTREYYELGFRPMVEDGYDLNGDGIAHGAFSFEQYQDALAKDYLRKPVEELLGNRKTIEDLPGGEHPVRKNANNFHNGRKIGDHRADGPDVEMHHIFGMGAVPDTIGQIRIRGRIVPQETKTNVTVSLARVTSRETEQVRDGADLLVTPEDGTLAVNPTNQFRLSEEIEVRFVAGDGTVPVASLARGFGSAASLNAPHARVYPLVGSFSDELTGHNPMLNTEAFLGLFDQVYRGLPVPSIGVKVEAVGTLTEGTVGKLTVTGTAPGGGSKPVGVVVDFGDGGVEMRNGTSGAPLTIEHKYRQSGTYLVTVGAASDDGVYGVSSLKMVVANDAPQVTILGGDIEVDLGDTRIFVAEVKDKGLDDRHTFVWTAPGGQSRGVNQFAVPVTFDEPGEKTVSVKVSDDTDSKEASIRVTVRRTPANLAGPSFGLDSAKPASRSARPALTGVEGGHPELIVRVHGHASGLLGTTGISFKEEAAGSKLVGSVLRSFDIAGGIGAAIDRLFKPLKAQFLGQLADDTEYWRTLRDTTADDPAILALLGARGLGRPMEVDVLYLEGGTPKVLRRWTIPKVGADEGIRLRFDWIAKNGTLERVTPGLLDGGALDGASLGEIEPKFTATNEEGAGDRFGPATVGILNPATDLVTLLGRDNLTSETNIVLFAVFDANENGRLEDDTFYPLESNVVRFARLPKRPFAVVGMDEQGNVGAMDPFRVAETRNYLGTLKPGQTESEYERKLRAIRTVVRESIAEARLSPVIAGRFLLDPADLWVFEQGSGANLWKANFVSRCNGIYLPGKSDNDYELFLPVRSAERFGFSEAERLRFEAAGPHSREMLEGDWYFRRPIGIDAAGAPTADDGAIVAWEYTLPGEVTVDGLPSFRVVRRETDDNLASGFRSPLTPADVIAREFTGAVKSNPARAALLPDTSFFPERREHFQFGRLHLQRPPDFGDDPIGDAGTGRQMLMMKWLLEGAFVTATDDGGAEEFSPGSPALTAVYANWKRVGVPRAEGYEWGVFQDFAALKSKPFQVAEMRLSQTKADGRLRLLQRSIDDAVAQQQASRLKKLGKAAIRATLARLAGDTNLNGILTRVPDSRVTDGSVRSFEHLIRELALGSEDAKKAFGDFAKDRDDLTEGPDVGDFLRAKNGDREYLATIINEPGAYERFVVSTFTFLRTMVQKPTLSPYKDFTAGLQENGKLDELQQRSDNLNRVLRGSDSRHPGLMALNIDRRIAHMDLPLSVEAYGPDVSGGIRMSTLRTSSKDPGPSANGRGAAPAGPGDPVEPGDLTAKSGSDNTLDGTEVGELLLSDEGSIDENAIAMDALGQVLGGDPTEADNDAGAAARRIGAVVPAPEISAEPELFLYVVSAAFGESPFLLTEHEQSGERLRSPEHVLRLSDQIRIEVIAPPGLGEFVASVQMANGREPIRIGLSETLAPGVYRNEGNGNTVQFTNQDPPPAGRIYIRDEELFVVDVKLPGQDEDLHTEVMIDLGEFALATVKHLDRLPTSRPRRDYQKSFVGAPDELTWAFVGADAFNDDVALEAVRQFIPDGDNAMRRFLRSFSDPAKSAQTGEADVMYVHTHGGSTGKLSDHVSDQPIDERLRSTVLDPKRHLAEDGLWNTDADWFISEACLMLFGGLNGPAPGGNTPPVSALAWRDVLKSSFPRRLHGILGFAFGKEANTLASQDFLQALVLGETYVDAWKRAGERARMPWAVLYYSSARDDTARVMSQDPLSDDTMIYDSFVGVPEGLCLDAADCCTGSYDVQKLEDGLWVKAGSWGGTVPADLPAGMVARQRDLLGAGSGSGRRVTRFTEWEEMDPERGQTLLSLSGATDGDGAQKAAEAFLGSVCGIDPAQLRWIYTGEAVRQTFQGDVLSAPVVTGRVVQYEMLAHGIPVSGSGVTVKVLPEGISRVSVSRVPMPVGGGDEERIQPLGLEEALTRYWSVRSKTEPGARVVLRAKLCWKVGSADGKAVPAWEIQWATADPAGVPLGVPETIWLDAAQGRLMEVSK
jgi:hypothetical protein